MKKRLDEYARLMRMDKPIGTYLLLWPTLAALWFASEGRPHALVLVVFICGVFLMRSAGCVLNDFIDRKLDTRVARTMDRPIAAGRVKPIEALILFGVLALIAFGLVLLMNTLTIILAVVALVLAAIYPITKRFVQIPQVFLGIAFNWGIIMAFAAETNHIPFIAWIFYIAALIWTVAYDTMYGMVDREDDLKIGIKSTAILFRKRDRSIIAVLQLGALLILLFVGWWLEMRTWYYAGLAIATLLFVYQQYLIKDREPAACFKAFLNNHWAWLVVFVGIFLSYCR